MVSAVRVVCSSSAVLFLLVGVGLIAAGVSVIKIVIPRAQRSLIMQDRALERLPDGSLNALAQSWANPGYISYKQYWIYNYTNPLDVQNRGSPPDMFEKGPYSYRVLRTNVIDDFSQEGAVITYRPKTVYVFDRATSCAGCDPSDVFLVPDIVFFKTINFFSSVEGVKEILCSLPSIGDLVCGAGDPEAINAMIKGLIESYMDYAALAIKALDAGPFVYTTVDELLFKGYDDPLFSKAVDFILDAVGAMSPPLAQQLPHNITSPNIHLNNKNATLGAEYIILTGKFDIERVGEVLSFFVGDNSTDNSDGSWLPSSWWTGGYTRQCPAIEGALARKINGTMGDLFAPLIQKKDTLYVYDEDLCRSVPLKYNEETTVKGVHGYRFAVPAYAFNWSMPVNCGFCHRLEYDIFSKTAGDECLPDGLIDISRCTTGKLPIAASSPHFLDASREVTRTFLRFRPDPETDQTTFDIEPMTGVLLKSDRRIQLNVMVNRLEHARTYQAMLPAAYPIVWMNTSTVIDDVSLRALREKVAAPYRSISIVCWAVGVGLGSLFILIAIAMSMVAVFSPHLKMHDKEPRSSEGIEASEGHYDDANSTGTIDSNDVFPMLSATSRTRRRIPHEDSGAGYENIDVPL